MMVRENVRYKSGQNERKQEEEEEAKGERSLVPNSRNRKWMEMSGAMMMRGRRWMGNIHTHTKSEGGKETIGSHNV